MTLASFFCLFQKPRYIAMLPCCCFFEGGVVVVVVPSCCWCELSWWWWELRRMMRKLQTTGKKQNQKKFSPKKCFFSFSKLRTRVGLAPPVFLLVHIAQVVLHPSLWLISTPIKTTSNRHKKDNNNLSLYCGTLFYFWFFPRHHFSSTSSHSPYAHTVRVSASIDGRTTYCFVNYKISGVIESMAPFKAILFRLKLRWEKKKMRRG